MSTPIFTPLDQLAPARRRTLLAARCIGAGLLIAASVPPWGWWPLALAGVALWDRVIAGQPRWSRFRRTWLVVVAWLIPSMLWMWDLTAPGYLIACASYAAYFGVTVMAVPPGRGRWLALPAAIVVAEQARWSFPFGGVPLSTLAMSQADSPLLDAARVAGPLLLVAMVVIGGIAISAAWERAWPVAGGAAGLVLALVLLGVVAPRGEATGTIEVALVQGGGEQRTRAADTDERVVFQRHLEASRLVSEPVDLVIWPENVVNVEGPITEHEWFPQLQQLARDLDATLTVGVVEGVDDDSFRNAQILLGPDGELVDRYDKVRIVPFGEFVPLRPIIEAVAGGSGIATRDAEPGSGPGVLSSELGDLGVAISWEIFFANRGREAAANGGQLLINPTNGSSYWLTQIQSQQVASSRLRAVETGRWVTQAAPTGFSALVNPEGEVVERTGISEQRVLQGEVELRSGDTWATTVGPSAVLLLVPFAYLGAWWLERRGGHVAASGRPVPH